MTNYIHPNSLQLDILHAIFTLSFLVKQQAKLNPPPKEKAALTWNLIFHPIPLKGMHTKSLAM